MKIRLLAFLLLLVSSTGAFATFIDDTVDVEIISPFDTVISDSVTVGPGIEAEVFNFIWDYVLDITADSITLTISKDAPAGNFTGIFRSIVLSEIDFEISSVLFNSTASSAFSGSVNPSLDWSTMGQVSITCSPFCSANSPASALSHTFTWDVAFEQVTEPSSLMLLMLGLIGLGYIRRRET